MTRNELLELLEAELSERHRRAAATYPHTSDLESVQTVIKYLENRYIRRVNNKRRWTDSTVMNLARDLGGMK